MSQCIIVKGGVRCTHDSSSHLNGGIGLPIMKPELQAWLCTDCICDLYTAVTARDFPGTSPLTPEQVKSEFGRR